MAWVGAAEPLYSETPPLQPTSTMATQATGFGNVVAHPDGGRQRTGECHDNGGPSLVWPSVV